MIFVSAIKPPRLLPNQAAGIIAPASPVKKEEISSALDLLQSFPLELRLGKHLLNSSNYLAGSDHDRISDVHHMFSDPNVKAIFCARGGYGSTRLLNKVDFDLIAKNPKLIIGFSDLTALLLALHKKCNLVTIHGPVLTDLPKGNNWKFLSGLITTSSKIQLPFSRGKIIRGGKKEGILIGGNLATICSLLETPFLPSFEDSILFLEEKGEAPYRIDRMLTNLLLSGRLNRVSAVIFGHMEGCGEKGVLHGIIEERLHGLGIPVATGLPAGHGEENFSLPLGVPALLDTDRMVLSIEEPAVL